MRPAGANRAAAVAPGAGKAGPIRPDTMGANDSRPTTRRKLRGKDPGGGSDGKPWRSAAGTT